MRRLPLRSPPRMRGKVNLLLDGNIPLGITPAYAGKSPPPARMPGLCRDHPRVCGEKFTRMSVVASMRGSPPRMRGKVAGNCKGAGAGGITPAYAGKRQARLPQSISSRDHPRVCGEKYLRVLSMIFSLGSPPRMRGKVKKIVCGLTALRITPAYAGKSIIITSPLISFRDHPRVCGEKGL